MKILVISDVHANFEALKSVLKLPHDAVLFAGDIVDYGPRPKECIETLNNVSYKMVRGNHDNAVAFNTDCGCSAQMHALSVSTRAYTKQILNKEEVEFLKRLPLKEEFTIDNKKFFMIHASNSDPLFTYLKADTPKEKFIKEFGNIDTDFIIYGHTHFPLVLRDIVKGIIVNPGSVGQPRDGIWLASCAIIDTVAEQVEIKRIPYNINKTEKEIKEAGLPEVLIDILKAE